MQKNGFYYGNRQADGNSIPQTNTRQSNMELLRLLSMLFVLVLHANYLALHTPGQVDLLNSPLSTLLRVLFEHFAIVAVNVFVLISGWFGIHPNWKRLTNLSFQVAFLSLAVVAFFFAAGLPFSTKYLIRSVYIGIDHWFVAAYLGLYMLSPMLNVFVAHSSKRQLELFLAGFFTVEFFYGWITNCGEFSSGCSMLSFIGLYLLAQYLRNYPGRWQTRNGKYFLALYAITMLANAILFLALLYLGHNDNRIISYVSPIVILGSVFLLLAFTRFRLQSCFINWLAASCFSIYLIHCHPLVLPYYMKWFKHLYDNFSGMPYLLLALLCILAIGFACILIDQLRIVCWKYLLNLSKRIPRTHR